MLEGETDAFRRILQSVVQSNELPIFFIYHREVNFLIKMEDYHFREVTKMVIPKWNILMERIYEIDPVIYPRLLWIAVNPKKEEIDNFFNEELKFDKSQDKPTVYYASKKINNKAGCLIMFASKKDMDINTITHEATHVGLNLFHELDIEYDGLHQEALAYFIGWVAKCCEQVKKSK